jgi:hypothetical protein
VHFFQKLLNLARVLKPVVPRLKPMRLALILLTITILADHARGQLISHDVSTPLNRKLVELASDVPAKLQGDASLSFDNLDVYFDGGSHGAFFDRKDGRKLILFFPHVGYWTPAARKNRTQPVAILIERDGKQLLVEIMPDSKLNQRIVDLIDTNISTVAHPQEKLDTLKRIRETLSKRTPLKEIADRLDAKSDASKPQADPFVGFNPFD